jgi:hypothetical protein
VKKPSAHGMSTFNGSNVLIKIAKSTLNHYRCLTKLKNRR